MGKLTNFKIAIIMGSIILGGVIGAIASATGYAALIAHSRSSWSPEIVGLIGVFGGALASVRISMDRSWQMAVKVAFGLVCAVALGTVAYLMQANQLAVKMAALPTAQYALIFAALFGIVATIASFSVKD